MLEAESDGAASSFYLEREIDLAARPVLEWRWRVEAPLAVADERVRAGDDFAARVYVVAPGEGLFALPIAISYVWSGSAPVGADWPNPFTSKVRMVAVESGPAHAGEWRRYRRNVREDFRRLFGREVDELGGRRRDDRRRQQPPARPRPLRRYRAKGGGRLRAGGQPRSWAWTSSAARNTSA